MSACESPKALQARRVCTLLLGSGPVPCHSTVEKLCALISLLRLCSGQNDTRIFTPVQPVVTTASEAIWSNSTVSQEWFFQTFNAECDVGWPLFEDCHHLQACNTHISLTGRSCIRTVWESPSLLTATLEAQSLEDIWRRLHHTLASGATMNAGGEYTRIDWNSSPAIFLTQKLVQLYHCCRPWAFNSQTVNAPLTENCRMVPLQRERSGFYVCLCQQGWEMVSHQC